MQEHREDRTPRVTFDFLKEELTLRAAGKEATGDGLRAAFIQVNPLMGFLASHTTNQTLPQAFRGIPLVVYKVVGQTGADWRPLGWRTDFDWLSTDVFEDVFEDPETARKYWQRILKIVYDKIYLL